MANLAGVYRPQKAPLRNVSARAAAPTIRQEAKQRGARPTTWTPSWSTLVRTHYAQLNQADVLA